MTGLTRTVWPNNSEQSAVLAAPSLMAAALVEQDESFGAKQRFNFLKPNAGRRLPHPHSEFISARHVSTDRTTDAEHVQGEQLGLIDGTNGVA